MSQQKKFIVTDDESVRNILIANGFCLVSDICGVYTFINSEHINFNFDSIDIKKIVYTNRLAF